MSQEPNDLVYFEDMKLGQEFHTDTYEVTEAEIIEFAKQYDPQIFHTDPIAAKDTFFEGLAASGWLTAALTMRLQILSKMKYAEGTIGLGVDITWPIPTRAGDILCVFNKVTELKELKSRSDRGFLILESETRNQNNQVVQKMITKALILRRKQT